jgi:hypothetical protein
VTDTVTPYEIFHFSELHIQIKEFTR